MFVRSLVRPSVVPVFFLVATHPPVPPKPPPPANPHRVSSTNILTLEIVYYTLSCMKERDLDLVERANYADHPLITPCDADLLDYYASLISEHHLPLSAMFDEDAQRARSRHPLSYFPQSYAPYIPSWGIVYYYWRRNGEDSFIDTIREIEDEVLSSASLSQSLQEEDPISLKIQTTKYDLIKKHYNTPAKTTSLRNRSLNNTLSQLSNEGLTALIASIERATSPDAIADLAPSTRAPQPVPSITTPITTPITEADL